MGIDPNSDIMEKRILGFTRRVAVCLRVCRGKKRKEKKRKRI